MKDRSLVCFFTAGALLLSASMISCKNIRDKNSPAIIPGRSAGPVSIGMERALILQMLGKPDETNEYDEGKTIYYSFYSRGMTLLVISGKLSTIFVYSGARGGYETGRHRAFTGKTAEGLNIRSTLLEVVNAFGQPESQTELLYAPIPSRCLSYKKKGISFDFIAENNEVIFITIFKPEE